MSDSLTRRADKVRVDEAKRHLCGECDHCRARIAAKAAMDEAHAQAQELTKVYMKVLMENPCRNKGTIR